MVEEKINFFLKMIYVNETYDSVIIDERQVMDFNDSLLSKLIFIVARSLAIFLQLLPTHKSRKKSI